MPQAGASVTFAVYHEPVLCRDAVDLLVPDPNGTYVDGTTGGGGHAEQICRRLQGEGRLVCMDADGEALVHSRERLRDFRERVSFVHDNFGRIRGAVEALGIRTVHGVLLDLGVSSHQLDEARRGFTFRADAPLDMRFDAQRGLNARDVVNTYDERRLEQVLREYGEEFAARKIARAIVRQRPIETTWGLAAAVERVVGGRYRTKSLARVFQAVRIEVNGELDNLRRCLADSVRMLQPGGRVVVIAYHSLEDRIVKEFFRARAGRGTGEREQPAMLKILTKKPIVPSDAEEARNPRSRSARLRAAERLPAGAEA